MIINRLATAIAKRFLAFAFAAALAVAPALADQSQLSAPTSGSLPGLTMVNDYNSALNALNTCNSGASAPSNQLSGGPSEGNCWLNTSTGALSYYDGTSWLTVGYIDTTNHIWTPVVGGNVATTIASASTANLCGASGASPIGAYETISGVTTITGFGSNCVVGQIKILTFSGALTLTQNATSLILPGGANITTAAGDAAVAIYLGSGNWKVVLYQPATGQPIASATQRGVPSAVGLVINNDGGTPNSKIDVAADFAQLVSSAMIAVQRSGVSVVVNDTINGAGGLDTGSVAASTWYYVFLIDNGTTTAGLMSLSATAPTLPGGYTFAMRVGAMRTDGSSNLYRTIQRGSKAQYVVTASSNTTALPTLATGTQAAWFAIAVAAFIPPTASIIRPVLVINENGVTQSVGLAPNNSYSLTPSVAASAPLWINSISASYLTNSMQSGDIILESGNIYYTSTNPSGAAYVFGWTDKVNAS